MNKIDEMIRWYEENETRREYTLTKAKLKLVKSLLQELRGSEDRMFMNEIMENFSAILELHRNVIADREAELETLLPEHGSVQQYLTRQNSFDTDSRLQTAFAAYLSRGQGRPLSSYTINDYCSRIRNVWRSFYAQYVNSPSEEVLSVRVQKVQPDAPLLNAFHHVEQMQCYVRQKLLQAEEKRNWANAAAALNKFAAFSQSLK